MDSTDQITLTGLRAFGWHGVYDQERRTGQTFIIDVTMYVDTRRAASTDEVTDTVHYGEIAEQVTAIVSGEPVHLLERLAERLADKLLAVDLVQRVRVTVHKPEAPIPVPFDDVAVTIDRVRTP